MYISVWKSFPIAYVTDSSSCKVLCVTFVDGVGISAGGSICIFVFALSVT